MRGVAAFKKRLGWWIETDCNSKARRRMVWSISPRWMLPMPYARNSGHRRSNGDEDERHRMLRDVPLATQLIDYLIYPHPDVWTAWWVLAGALGIEA